MVTEIIVGAVAILGSWGSIWYKLGKLTVVVDGHGGQLKTMNRKLNRLVKNSRKGG